MGSSVTGGVQSAADAEAEEEEEEEALATGRRCCEVDEDVEEEEEEEVEAEDVVGLTEVDAEMATEEGVADGVEAGWMLRRSYWCRMHLSSGDSRSQSLSSDEPLELPGVSGSVSSSSPSEDSAA